jgi:hypothetical protein
MGDIKSVLEEARRNFLAKPYPEACLSIEQFDKLRQYAENNDITNFRAEIGVALQPKGLEEYTGQEIQEGKEMESEKFSLFQQIRDYPDTFNEITSDWLRKTMKIPEGNELSFDTSPMGNSTQWTASTNVGEGKRIYISKGATDINKEIFNSIRGEILGISPEMYNVGFFRMPVECFMYLIDLTKYNPPELYNLNVIINKPQHCLEFEKLVDYDDLNEQYKTGEDKDKLKKSYEDLIRRSSIHGKHRDHNRNGHNVVVKVDDDKITSYFIDMGSFVFKERAHGGWGKDIRNKKKRRKKKRKNKTTRKKSTRRKSKNKKGTTKKRKKSRRKRGKYYF